MSYRDTMIRRGEELTAQYGPAVASIERAYYHAQAFWWDELEATRGIFPADGAVRASRDCRLALDHSKRTGAPYVDPPGTYAMVQIGDREVNDDLRRWVGIFGGLGHGSTSFDDWIKAGKPNHFAGRYIG